MVVAILADEGQKHELLMKSKVEGVEFVWPDSVRALKIVEADVYFDLLFEFDRERMLALRSVTPRLLFVNSVIHTYKDIGNLAWRLNAWPTMLGRSVVELSERPGFDDAELIKVDQVFNSLGWKRQLVPDVPGMITPRVVSMIINEAWFTLGEKISTREEIDTAMKLGTNYPYGPFEWGEIIGLSRVAALLSELSRTDSRYAIAPLLKSYLCL